MWKWWHKNGWWQSSIEWGTLIGQQTLGLGMWILSQSLLGLGTWILNSIKHGWLIYRLGFEFCKKRCRIGANSMQHHGSHSWLASLPNILWNSHQVPPPSFKWRTPYQLKQKHDDDDEWALCATFKQKLAKKEATTQMWDAQKDQLLTFKCARKVEKKDCHVVKWIRLEKITTNKRFDEQSSLKQCGKVGDALHLAIKANLFLAATIYHTPFYKFASHVCKYNM
jgi:hypothetical protein